MKSEELLEKYVLEHIDAEGDYLYRLYRTTNIQLLHGRMASGHLQGRLLKMLVEMVRPRNILEVGTFSGYSAICLAEGLSEGGKLYTFEINDEQEDFTRPWIEGSDVADKIEFIIGDAIKEAPRLGVTFDMAFIDGDKRTYIETYEMALTVMRPGGFIIADNTLWDGHVVDAAYDRDQQTLGIRRFNDYVANDARVEKVILPLRDGLTIMRIRSPSNSPKGESLVSAPPMRSHHSPLGELEGAPPMRSHHSPLGELEGALRGLLKELKKNGV